VKRGLALAAGAAAFVILAAANAGGYRYGISDQAFYIPAIAHAADPSLFPRDTAVLAPQMTLWAGDEILALALRTLPVEMPTLFAALYLLGVLLLYAGGVFFARGLGASWLAVAGATALLTLRHRITKTGANTLEGYMHPRMIAFALGLIGLGCLLRRRWALAVGAVATAGVVHPTTALWFGAAIGFAFLATWDLKVRAGLIAVVGLPTLGYALMAPRMDPEWLAVLGERDYLFPHDWPLYAWAANLFTAGVVYAVCRRRHTAGLDVPGERVLVRGLLSLVGVFLVSVPLTALYIAPVVQLQINRVFWLIDAVALIYVAWWLIDWVTPKPRLRMAVTALLVALACGRGAFILHDTGRALARVELADDDWTEAMQWIRTRPVGWQVLADPGHAWKYGASVRVAAWRDVLLEQSKDSAMAMYDRTIASRVADRASALAEFERFNEEQFRSLGAKYDAHVLVVERPRELALPRLYDNERFVIYGLR